VSLRSRQVEITGNVCSRCADHRAREDSGRLLSSAAEEIFHMSSVPLVPTEWLLCTRHRDGTEISEKLCAPLRELTDLSTPKQVNRRDSQTLGKAVKVTGTGGCGA
jgi:hypothetical protein